MRGWLALNRSNHARTAPSPLSVTWAAMCDRVVPNCGRARPTRPFHRASQSASSDRGASLVTRRVLNAITRARCATPYHEAGASLACAGERPESPCGHDPPNSFASAAGVHGCSRPSRASPIVPSASEDHHTSAIGRSFSAIRRCTSPIVLVASVSPRSRTSKPVAAFAASTMACARNASALV